MFLGEFEHALDDKGRISVPAKFRTALADGLVMTRGFERCLFVWALRDWQSIARRLGEASLLHADARRLHRLVFASATDTVPDRLGRVLIPAFLREYAALRDAAVIAGLHNRIEIWDPAHWRAEQARAQQESSRLAEDLFALGL